LSPRLVILILMVLVGLVVIMVLMVIIVPMVLMVLMVIVLVLVLWSRRRGSNKSCPMSGKVPAVDPSGQVPHVLGTKRTRSKAD